MNWQDHIHADPAILVGKPVIKGTRLSVEFLLGLKSAGWPDAQILEAYPQLTPEALQAVFAYSEEAIREDVFFSFEPDGD